MELKAAGANRRQDGIRPRSDKDQRGRVGRLFQDLEEYVGIVPAHGIGAIEDEDAAAALRAERRGPLDGAQLADADHRTSYRRSQANGIWNDGPDVGIRLQNQRLALDGRGVGAFATFGEALLDQRVRVGEAGDFRAGITFAAEIVFQAFAVRGLREHSGEREFADAARAGEKQGAGHSLACEHAFECGDDAFVAEKLIEAHE